MTLIRSVECGPNKRQRYTVSETPAGPATLAIWRMADNFFNLKTDLNLPSLNMLVQNFDLFSSETISSNKSLFYKRHQFVPWVWQWRQCKATTLKYTFVETAFVVLPIHWIPSNLVTVSILSFWMAAPSNRPPTMFLLANCLE